MSTSEGLEQATAALSLLSVHAHNAGMHDLEKMAQKALEDIEQGKTATPEFKPLIDEICDLCKHPTGGGDTAMRDIRGTPKYIRKGLHDAGIPGFGSHFQTD